jgi:hypothetical protein
VSSSLVQGRWHAEATQLRGGTVERGAQEGGAAVLPVPVGILSRPSRSNDISAGRGRHTCATPWSQEGRNRRR